MSYSTLLGIKDNKVYELEEYSNAWGTLPVIWECMYETYLEPNHKYDTFLKRGNDIIALVNKNIPTYCKVLILTTCDKWVISKDYRERFYDDVQKFLIDLEINPDYVNHWAKVAEDVKNAKGYESYGLWCSSVSENPFVTYDEETEKEHFDGKVNCIYTELYKED